MILSFLVIGLKMAILKKWSDQKSAQIPHPEVSYKALDQDPEWNPKKKPVIKSSLLEKAAFILLVLITLCIGFIMVLFALKVIGGMLTKQENKLCATGSCTMEENDRFDCWPEYVGATKDKCEARGCCWQPATTHGPPYCFFPGNYSGYTASNLKTTASGVTADLTRTTTTLFPPDIKKLKLQIDFQTESQLRVKVMLAISFFSLFLSHLCQFLFS